jgi:hypothetical protein
LRVVSFITEPRVVTRIVDHLRKRDRITVVVLFHLVAYGMDRRGIYLRV